MTIENIKNLIIDNDINIKYIKYINYIEGWNIDLIIKKLYYKDLKELKNLLNDIIDLKMSFVKNQNWEHATKTREIELCFSFNYTTKVG